MQDKMKEAQDQIKKIEVEGEAGGNLVKVKLSGDYELKSIIISDAAKKEKQEMEDSHLEDIPNDGQGTDRENQSIGLHDPVLKSPDKPAGPS